MTYVEYYNEPVVGHFLWLTSELLSKLPPQTRFTSNHNLVGPEEWFDAELLDRETGQTLQATIAWIAYDDASHWELGDGKTLAQYFYAEHWCECHRAGDITSEGFKYDGNCGDDRFLVKKLTHRAMPDVVLYFEELESTADERQGASD